MEDDTTATSRASGTRPRALVKLFNRIVEDRVSLAAHASGGRLSGRGWPTCTTSTSTALQRSTGATSRTFSCASSSSCRRRSDSVSVTGCGTRRSRHPAGCWWTSTRTPTWFRKRSTSRSRKRSPYNVVVVGDDDQALYRFRGGSVECMVSFDAGVPDVPRHRARSRRSVPAGREFPLAPRHRRLLQRLHHGIPVDGAARGARPEQADARRRRAHPGQYPAVGQLRAETLKALADRFARRYRTWFNTASSSDYSQCCLLLQEHEGDATRMPRGTSTRYAPAASPYTTPATRRSWSSRKWSGFSAPYWRSSRSRRAGAIPQPDGPVEPRLRGVYRAEYAQLAAAQSLR